MKNLVNTTLAAAALAGAFATQAAPLNGSPPPAAPEQNESHIITFEGERYDMDKVHKLTVAAKIGNAKMAGILHLSPSMDDLKAKNIDDKEFEKISSKIFQNELQAMQDKSANECYKDEKFIEIFSEALNRSVDKIESDFRITVISVDKEPKFIAQIEADRHCGEDKAPHQKNPEQQDNGWYKKPQELSI